MRIRNHSAAALLVLLLAASANAAEPATTPEALIEDLAAAINRADVNAFLSYLTGQSRKVVDEWLADQASLRAAQEPLANALDEQFGAGEPIPTSPPKDFESVLRRISAFELLSKQTGRNGTVALRVKTSLTTGETTTVEEEIFVARRENGVWKLELNPGPRINVALEKSVLDRVTAAVRNGEFGDRRSALLALRQLRLQKTANTRVGQHGAAIGETNLSPTTVPPARGPSDAVISISPNNVAPSR